jgi:hypothetical protein
MTKNPIPKELKRIIDGKNLILKELLLGELIRLNNNLENLPHSQDYILEAKQRIFQLEQRNVSLAQERKEQTQKLASNLGDAIRLSENQKKKQ